MAPELNVSVGGEAGQGIQTIGFVLAKTLSRSGLAVFTDQDYESRIRGGHNFFRVRAGTAPVKAQSDSLDILIALDQASLDLQRADLKPDGLVLLDSTALKMTAGDTAVLDIPLEKLALEKAGNTIMANSVAVGAVLGLLEFPFEILADTLQWHFAGAAEAVRTHNITAARAGYNFARAHRPPRFQMRFPEGRPSDRLFMNGNEAVALGAMAAGCRLAAIYPMTPITGILEYLAAHGGRYGVGVVQPEDEIAAINMVVGAAYAGVRAMTATSGSGFALMVEGLGLSGITETPVVIVLGQRPGPAVGLPTHTEQGELLFAVRAGTGEFPRIVLAPADAEEAFSLTIRAFNLAEQFQVPVIILTDTHLANCYTDVARFDLSGVRIERGPWLAAAQAQDYRRYRLTADGVSPRLVPGSAPQLVAADADEHDENGHLTENASIRVSQNTKRLQKYTAIRAALNPPRFHQAVNAALTLIGWGSTYGAIREAAAELQSRGIAVNVLHLSEIWPFPLEFMNAALKAAPHNVVIESNHEGQLAALIRAETGIAVDRRINRFDGRPISARYILDNLDKGVVRP